jgi:hypothetical protein
VLVEAATKIDGKLTALRRCAMSGMSAAVDAAPVPHKE